MGIDTSSKSYNALAFFTNIVLISALTYTFVTDFLEITVFYDHVIAWISIASLIVSIATLGKKGKTPDGLFKIAAVTGCAFYVLRFVVLVFAYYGLYVMSPQSIWTFYFPALLVVITVLYRLRAMRNED